MPLAPHLGQARYGPVHSLDVPPTISVNYCTAPLQMEWAHANYRLGSDAAVWSRQGQGCTRARAGAGVKTTVASFQAVPLGSRRCSGAGHSSVAWGLPKSVWKRSLFASIGSRKCGTFERGM